MGVAHWKSKVKYHGDEISKGGLRPPAESNYEISGLATHGKRGRGHATYRGGPSKKQSKLVVAQVRAAFGRPPYIPYAYDKHSTNTPYT